MNKFPFLVIVLCIMLVSGFGLSASADTVGSEPSQTTDELISEIEQFQSDVESRLEATPTPTATISPEPIIAPVTLSTVNDSLILIMGLLSAILGSLTIFFFLRFMWR